MYKKGDKVRIVRISPRSPTASHMIGPLMQIYEVSRWGDNEVWVRQLDGEHAGCLWVCLADDLEYDKPLTPLECLIKTYVDEQRKELGL